MSLGRKLVLGNWKLNGRLAQNEELVRGILQGMPTGVDVGVCAPFPYLPQLQTLLEGRGLVLGAQDVSAFATGAYTGEVSAGMLSEFGVRFVIVGHSERRAFHGESDELVGRKMAAVVQAGMVPVLCCGESLEQHEAGEAKEVIERQVRAALAASGLQEADGYVVAYEPIWAIGTGLVATPQHVDDVHVSIKALVAPGVRVLYGGSVKADNAQELFACESVDGALVGGASLKVDEYLAICAAAAATA